MTASDENMNQTSFRPFEIIHGDAGRGILLTADHASRALPPHYGMLGLPREEFDRHIAYDIGVEHVTRSLASLLNVPAVLNCYSRLLIDPNRGEDDPTLIRQLYDGTVISGNYPMSAEERQNRIESYFRPYHHAVEEQAAQIAGTIQGAPLIIAVHSFTPCMQGRQRPWHVGILWDCDGRAARPMINMLAADKEIIVGDNEPYDGALRGDALFHHATRRGYPHALIEVRQDLIADEAGAEAWARRLVPIIEEINALPDMHHIAYFGSRTGPVDHILPEHGMVHETGQMIGHQARLVKEDEHG